MVVVTNAEGESGTVALVSSTLEVDETGGGTMGILMVVVGGTEGWTDLAGAGLLQTTLTLRPELTPSLMKEVAAVHTLPFLLMLGESMCCPLQPLAE